MSKTGDTVRRRKRMRQIVAEFQKYVATYTDERFYEDYSDATFINDMLYGIGIALDHKYRGSDGYRAFCNEHLANLAAAQPEARE